MDQARLTAIREWNESLKHDTDQPYRNLVRAHLVIEDMLNEIERLTALAREMREAAQYGKPLARIDAEHASWPRNREAAQRFLDALKAWDDQESE